MRNIWKYIARLQHLRFIALKKYIRSIITTKTIWIIFLADLLHLLLNLHPKFCQLFLLKTIVISLLVLFDERNNTSESKTRFLCILILFTLGVSRIPRQLTFLDYHQAIISNYIETVPEKVAILILRGLQNNDVVYSLIKFTFLLSLRIICRFTTRQINI